MSYYDTPSEEVFNDIKECSIKIWQTYDDQFGYATEKITQVKDITNVRDNWGFIVGMFDSSNQQRLLNLLSDDARELVEKYI